MVWWCCLLQYKLYWHGKSADMAQDCLYICHIATVGQCLPVFAVSTPANHDHSTCINNLNWLQEIGKLRNAHVKWYKVLKGSKKSVLCCEHKLRAIAENWQVNWLFDHIFLFSVKSSKSQSLRQKPHIYLYLLQVQKSIFVSPKNINVHFSETT